MDGMPSFGEPVAVAGLGLVAVGTYDFAFVVGGLKSTPTNRTMTSDFVPRPIQWIRDHMPDRMSPAWRDGMSGPDLHLRFREPQVARGDADRVDAHVLGADQREAPA